MPQHQPNPGKTHEKPKSPKIVEAPVEHPNQPRKNPTQQTPQNPPETPNNPPKKTPTNLTPKRDTENPSQQKLRKTNPKFKGNAKNTGEKKRQKNAETMACATT